MMFQSHAGSIEAMKVTGVLLAVDGSFNPTLVRLRRLHPREHGWEVERFNPTLVRLRPKRARKPSPKGWGFNPTLVRLRRCASGWTSSGFSSFNPTLVRLRPFCEKRKIFIKNSFQSHAGSIEAMMTSPNAGRYTRFQSHAGSIEARVRRRRRRRKSCVSIPRWFD